MNKKSNASERMRNQWRNPIFQNQMRMLRTGRHHSEETKAKISAANKGHFHTEEYKEEASLKKGGIAIMATPLLLRGAMVEEVAQITGYKRTAIRDLITRLRKKRQLQESTKEELSLRQKRAHQGKPKFGVGRVYCREDQNAFIFAGAICKKRLITKDLTNWQRLVDLYQERARSLPDNFATRVRLEFFLYAVEQARCGNRKLLEAYHELGRNIDTAWFITGLSDEENFIINATEEDDFFGHLPKKLDEYSPRVQKAIRLIAAETSLLINEKMIFLAFLVHCQTAGGIKETAESLGLTPEEAQRLIYKAKQLTDDDHWSLLERLVNQLNENNNRGKIPKNYQ